SRPPWTAVPSFTYLLPCAQGARGKQPEPLSRFEERIEDRARRGFDRLKARQSLYARAVPHSAAVRYLSPRAWPRAYPAWIAPLLGLPLALSLLTTLLMILVFAFPAGGGADARAGGAAFGIFFLAISVFLGLAVLGIVRDETWARGVASAAALFIALTGAGILIAAPVLWGLWRSPRSRSATGAASPGASTTDVGV